MKLGEDAVHSSCFHSIAVLHFKNVIIIHFGSIVFTYVTADCLNSHNYCKCRGCNLQRPAAAVPVPPWNWNRHAVLQYSMWIYTRTSITWSKFNSHVYYVITTRICKLNDLIDSLIGASIRTIWRTLRVLFILTDCPMDCPCELSEKFNMFNF